MVILNKHGKIVSNSQNLRGIRKHASQYLAKRIIVTKMSNGGAKLHIVFQNKSQFSCHFASYIVLLHTLKNWRNLRGTPITINGIRRGILQSDNSIFQEISCGLA